jgi:hypothetical protein
MLRRTIAALVGASVAGGSGVSAWALAEEPSAAPTKHVVSVTKLVLGPRVPCLGKNRNWGPLQLRLRVRKTTTTVGTKTTVAIKILSIGYPVLPDATFRTRYINDEALPLLTANALAIQSAQVDAISGATDTVVAYKKSLLGALANARRPS